MINDNPKPNKVDMRGIQKKGIGGDAYDGFAYFLFIIFFVVVAFELMQPRQKNNTHTIDCKTKIAPKI
jgi:hypothetical protein